MTGTIKKPRGRPRTREGAAVTSPVATLDRALNLLLVLAQSDGITLTDVSRRAGVSAPTAYRMLITLAGRGFVRNDETLGLWYVGVEAFRTGSAFTRDLKVVDIGRGVMHELMHCTGETANLAVEDDGDVVFVSQVECHEAIRAFFRPGTRGPIHASGVGKALLAQLPAARVGQLTQRKGLHGYTEKTITDLEALSEDLEQIRRRGWSLDDEERHRGMRCIASPIFNLHGEALAGISVSGPTVRMQDRRLAEIGSMVKDAAAQITTSIGGVTPKRKR
ncbi:MAG: HTH-type transcriptional regulator BhcR [Gammaproteobacteria bacterium]